LLNLAKLNPNEAEVSIASITSSGSLETPTNVSPSISVDLSSTNASCGQAMVLHRLWRLVVWVNTDTNGQMVEKPQL